MNQVVSKIPPNGLRKAKRNKNKTEPNAERHSGTHGNNGRHSSGPGDTLGLFSLCLTFSVLQTAPPTGSLPPAFAVDATATAPASAGPPLLRLWPGLSQVAGVALPSLCSWDGAQERRRGGGGSRSPPPPRAGLAHLVVVGDGGFAQLPFKVQLEGEIQVPLRGGEEERGEEKRREGFQRRAEARSSGPAADLRPELFLLI